VNERFAEGCLSYKQSAIQMSDYDGQTAELAVDGRTTTYSCTNNDRGNPWWVVDLGQAYEIGYLVITLPNVAGDDCNYIVHLASFIYSFIQNAFGGRDPLGSYSAPPDP